MPTQHPPNSSTPEPNLQTPITVIIRFGFPLLPDLTLHLHLGDTIDRLAADIKTVVPSEYRARDVTLIVAGRPLRNKDQNLHEVRARLGPGVEQNRIILLCMLRERDVGTTRENNNNTTLEATPEQDAHSDPTYLHPSATSPSNTSATIPLGFNSLRGPGGHTPAEIAALRRSYRSIISARYTPDQMPSEAAMLHMEERWLRESAFPSSSSPARNTDTTATPNASYPNTATNTNTTNNPDANPNANNDGLGSEVDLPTEEEDAARALDDTLLGVLTGFFWPLGAVVWGLREEGVWSRRRGWSVLAGVVVNLGFGVVRVMG